MLLTAIREPKKRSRFKRKTSPEYDLNLGIMTLVCCAVEALGRFHSGGTKTTACPTCGARQEEPSSGQCFRNFIEAYVPDYKPFSSVLYGEFRSALAHTFAIRKGGITQELGEPFTKGNGKSTPHRVDFDRFIEAVDKGVDAYFEALRRDSDLRTRFLNYWDRGYKFWVHASRRNAAALARARSD